MKVRPKPGREDGWLDPEATYTVLGISARSGEVKFRIWSDDNDTPALFSNRNFEIVEPSASARWVISLSGEDGAFELEPADWVSEGFWEAYFDGEPGARDSFAKEREALDVEAAGGSPMCPLTTAASLALLGRQAGQPDVAISVAVGVPYQVGDDEWACPVAVRPLYEQLRDQHGGESFQEMFLAMRLALTLLKDFTDKGGVLLMNGEETSTEDDGTFPFEAYTVDFEPTSRT